MCSPGLVIFGESSQSPRDLGIYLRICPDLCVWAECLVDPSRWSETVKDARRLKTTTTTTAIATTAATTTTTTTTTTTATTTTTTTTTTTATNLISQHHVAAETSVLQLVGSSIYFNHSEPIRLCSWTGPWFDSHNTNNNSHHHGDDDDDDVYV